MKKTKLIMSGLFSFVLANSLYAANHKLTLDEAIEIALHNNAKLKVSQTAIKIADTMYNQAMSASYPTLDASVNAMRMDQAPMYELRGVTKIDNTQTINMYNGLSGAAAVDGNPTLSNAYGAIANATPKTSELPVSMSVQTSGRDIAVSKIQLQYPLYTGGKITSIINQAQIGKLIAAEGKKRTTNEVVFDIKRYYYGVKLAENLKQLASDTQERMSFVRDLTEKLYKGGSLHVKKTDYLRSELSVELIESLDEEIKQKEEMAKAALVFAMGLPWTDTVELSDREFKKPNMSKTLANLVNDAYKFNPDYTRLKMAIKINGEKIKEAKSDYYPTVGLMASAQNLYSDYHYGMTNETNRNSWTIGVGVNWSLFNGMRTTNKVQQSRLEKLQLEQKQIILKDALALQVKQAFLQMKNSYKQYEILSKASKTASQNRDLNTRAYQEDMVSTKDVIEAQLMESYTLGAYYRALHDNALAHANADYIVAKSIEEELKK